MWLNLHADEKMDRFAKNLFVIKMKKWLMQKKQTNNIVF